MRARAAELNGEKEDARIADEAEDRLARRPRIDGDGAAQRRAEQAARLAPKGIVPGCGRHRALLHEKPHDEDGEGDESRTVAAPFELNETPVEKGRERKGDKLDTDADAKQAPGPWPIAGKGQRRQPDGDHKSPEKYVRHAGTGWPHGRAPT